ncbi:hypothetical protein IQ247_22000 [Plectonema cf. radiosum LEGE 06105]|uniref:Uncharacterized protein n=1 Tax=Plectonema cf. radiosum LEGE 06105 TaxID=945769 RepID=A0A8J7F323_9CYAN|nr:hypothetical protein [Plectonema radiosum]MBE9215301.1 hypothetical protein [Plectonema cf. radiosum LEGE 06105]
MHLINQPNKKQSNILPLFTVAIFSVNLLALGLLIFNASMLNRITNYFPQVLGQLVDGKAISFAPQEYHQRHPESIRRFVGESLTLMFTWSKKQSPETVLNFSSQLVSKNLGNKFISEINPEGNGENIESFFIIESISSPEKIKPGIWQLNVNARRVFFLNKDMNGESTVWRKNIIVEAVDSPIIQSEKPLHSLQKAVYDLSEVQLKILNVCDVTDKVCLDTSV